MRCDVTNIGAGKKKENQLMLTVPLVIYFMMPSFYCACLSSRGGGDTLACWREGGVPIRTRGQTLVRYSRYKMYFVSVPL